MPDIDSLSIQITAVSDQADRTLQGLIRKLRDVQGALNMQVDGNLAKGMDDLSASLSNLDSAMREIDPNRLKMVARSLSALSKASRGLSDLSQVTLKPLAQTSQEAEAAFSGLSNEAKETAKTIVEKYGIGADRMKDLASHVRDLYAGDTSAAPKLVNFINKYGDLEKVLTRSAEQAKEIRELFRSGIKLPEDLDTYYRGREDRRKLLADFGIRNINKGRENGMKWDGPDGYAEVISNITGDNSFREMTSGAEVLDNALRFIKQHLGEMETKLEVVEDIIGHVAQLSQNIKPIEVKGDEFLPVSNEPIGFLGEDTVEKVNQVTQAVQQANEVIKVNPFDEIADGLTQLGQVQVPDFTGIKNLASAMGRLTGENIQSVSSTLPQIAQALNTLDGVRVPNLEGLDTLASGLRSLGSKNVRAAADALPKLVSSLRELGGDLGELGRNVDTIGSLGKAFASLGYKSVQNAIENMPKLAESFNQMAQTLSRAPQVSENTIRLAQAMGGLSGNAMRAGAAVGRAGKHFNLFNNIAQRTQKSTRGLAQVIGKIYATYWLLFRAFGKIKEAIGVASDLTEVQNVVDTVFGDARDKVQDFADTAIMTFGMSELSAKDFASRFQAMGTAMGITDKQVIAANTALDKSLVNTKRNIEGVADSYKDLGTSTADMSINLTKLAADIGSFYNKDYSDVADDLASIYTGQTRPLRAYGLDLTEATLKEYAMSQGLDSNIKKMTQAEKTMLRYRYVMANMGHVMNDYAITADTWANVTRTIGEQFKKLGQIIGQGLINTFKPALIKFRDFLNGLIGLTEKTLNAVGKLLGWQIEITEVGLESAEDSSEGIADNLGDAGKNAKELNKQLEGFDRLNNLTTPKDNSGSGSGGGGATGGGASGGKTSGGGVKFKPYESEIDSWRGLGEAIATVISDELDSIKWNEIYAKAAGFGQGLADFMNGLFAGEKGKKLFGSLGSTIAGAVNTVMIAADTWAGVIEWAEVGSNIKDGLVKFLEDWKPEIAGSALGKLASGIATALYAAVSDKEAWALLGAKVGTGIQSMLDQLATPDKKTGLTFWESFFGSIAGVANGISTAVLKAVSEIEWKKLGTEIKKGIEKFLKKWKPEIAGEALAKLANGIAEALYPTLSDKKTWKKLGTKIADGINAFITNTDWDKHVANLVNGFLGLVTAIATVIKKVNWKEVAKAVVTAIGSALEELSKDPEQISDLLLVAGTAFGFHVGESLVASMLAKGGIGKGISSSKGLKDTIGQSLADNLGGSWKNGTLVFNIGMSLGVTELFLEWGAQHKKLKDMDDKSKEWSSPDYDPEKALAEDEANNPLLKFVDSITDTVKKAFERKPVSVDMSLNLAKGATNSVVKKANKEFAKNPAELKTQDGNTDDDYRKIWDFVNGRWIATTKDSYLELRSHLGTSEKEVYKWWDSVNEKWVTGTREKYLKVKTGISDKQASTDKDAIWTKMVEKWGTNKKLSVGAKSSSNLNSDINGKDDSSVWSKTQSKWGDKKKLPVGAKSSSTLGSDLSGKSNSSSVWATAVAKWGTKLLPVGLKFAANALSDLWKTLTEFFKDKKVEVGSSTSGGRPFAKGGAFYNNKWHNIPQYASGGLLPTHGSLFIAGEAGSEVVGHIGGRTEVLNESQLASVMYDSVNSAMAQQNALLREEISYLKTIAAKDMSISSRDVFNAVRSESTDYKNRTGRLAFGV